MIVPDINLLIYAYDSGSRNHLPAKAWWEACMSGTEPVGLLAVVLFGFVRIRTNPRVFENPMAVGAAIAHVRAWLAQPATVLIEPGHRHVDQALEWLEMIGTAGNLTTDAQIAAAVLEYQADLHTSDADFARFPGLRWTNPLSA